MPGTSRTQQKAEARYNVTTQCTSRSLSLDIVSSSPSLLCLSLPLCLDFVSSHIAIKKYFF